MPSQIYCVAHTTINANTHLSNCHTFQCMCAYQRLSLSYIPSTRRTAKIPLYLSFGFFLALRRSPCVLCVYALPSLPLPPYTAHSRCCDCLLTILSNAHQLDFVARCKHSRSHSVDSVLCTRTHGVCCWVKQRKKLEKKKLKLEFGKKCTANCAHSVQLQFFWSFNKNSYLINSEQTRRQKIVLTKNCCFATVGEYTNELEYGEIKRLIVCRRVSEWIFAFFYFHAHSVKNFKTLWY